MLGCFRGSRDNPASRVDLLHSTAASAAGSSGGDSASSSFRRCWCRANAAAGELLQLCWNCGVAKPDRDDPDSYVADKQPAPDRLAGSAGAQGAMAAFGVEEASATAARCFTRAQSAIFCGTLKLSKENL